MEYSIEQLEQDIAKIVAGLADMRRVKGHDYSGEKDTLANLRRLGVPGVFVRISDKFERLANYYIPLIKDESAALQVSDESLQDTWNDLCNYVLIALTMLANQEE